MKVLVTGGSGFIGGYLVRELEENGYDVYILSRKTKGENVINGDIRRIEDLSKAFKGMDAIFHNAAYAMDWGRKKDFYEVNVRGTENVAKACSENGIRRVVFTSSAGVYGFPDSMKEIVEEDEKKPLNIYQKSKLLAEIALKKYDLHSSIVRPPLVLGAGAKAAKILISSIENGSFSYIGDGNTFITIVHPADVAKCLRLALEKDDKGEEFNVASFSCRVREMVEKIADEIGVERPQKEIPYKIAYLFSIFQEFLSFMGREPKITRFRVKSMGSNRIIGYEKAKKMLGYKPSYNLDKTVKEMIEWYRNQ